MLADVNGLLNTGKVTGGLVVATSVPHCLAAHPASCWVCLQSCSCPKCSSLEGLRLTTTALWLTGLFTPEEQALLLDQLHPWLATQPEMRPGRAAAWEAFIHRARHHLHIVFATSPAGTAFRTRCRQFPSLVNCMTIDWFSPWPAEALLGVGVRVLEGLDLGPGAASPEGAAAAPAIGSVQNIVARVARMCVDIQKGVEAAADRLLQEQQIRWGGIAQLARQSCGVQPWRMGSCMPGAHD